MRPKKQVKKAVRAHLNNELRAPETTDIRGDRDAPAAGSQSFSYARRIVGKRGVQSGVALPYLVTEFNLKVAPATSIHATEAQAPSPHSD